MLRCYKRVTIDDVAERAGVGKGIHLPALEEPRGAFPGGAPAELVAALDELLDTLRRDPEVALLHRMTRALFLAIMHRPLLRALYTADQEVLGRLAKGDDKALEIREEMAFSDYLGLLAEHGVLRADIAPEELAYAYRATVNGFILIESFIDENYQFDPERKADLLASTVQRAREVERLPPSDTVRSIALE